jgi:hypothetical protein
MCGGGGSIMSPCAEAPIVKAKQRRSMDKIPMHSLGGFITLSFIDFLPGSYFQAYALLDILSLRVVHLLHKFYDP